MSGGRQKRGASTLGCDSCGRGDVSSLTLDGTQLLCPRCRDREARARERRDHAVARRRVLAIDLSWCHPADRRSAARKINRAASRAAPEAAQIMLSLADAIRGNNPTASVDLTSVSETTAQGVATMLDDLLEHEITGPLRDLLIAITSSWLDWQRHE